MIEAGLATVTITPPVGCVLSGFFTPRYAKNVRDPLQAKVFALRHGPRTALIVLCDLIGLPLALTGRIKQSIHSVTGLPAAGMSIACTHNHCGPATLPLFGMEVDEQYCAGLVERITGAAQSALRQMEPVRVGAAWVQGPPIVYNRRFLMCDGHYATNPGYLNPDIVRPAGPVDAGLPLLVLARPSGEPLAILASLNSHYIGGDMWEISADSYGIFSRQVRRKLGRECQVALAYGCGGDINNIDVTRPKPADLDDWGHAEREMEKLSDCALQALDSVQWFDDPPLDWRVAEIELPNRRPAPDEIARARTLLKGGGLDLQDGLDMSDSESAAAKRQLDLFFARELLRLADRPPPTRTLAQTIRIGGLAITAFPGEFFAEYALRLRRQSPATHNLPLGLANDCCGYLPTPDAFAQLGTYETRLSAASHKVPEAGDRYLELVLAQLRALFGP